MGSAIARGHDGCREGEVALLAGEVATIARALSVAPERFATLSAVEDPQPGEVTVALDAGPRRWRLVLRRRDEGQGRSRCVFLVGAGKEREVCGLGELAPAACRGRGAVGDGARHRQVIERWNEVATKRPLGMQPEAFLQALLAEPGPEVDARGALPEARSRSGCATCPTSRCCVVFHPELTGADLVRLMHGRGLAAGEIAELRPTRGDQAGPDAIHLGDERAWDLRLRQTGARGETAESRCCAFLVDLSSGTLPPARRCGVYAHRPMVCRLFPSEATELGVMVETPEAICPPGAWSQERADVATLGWLHRRAREERARFRDFVARWNEDARTALAGRPQPERVTMFLDALVADVRASGAGAQPSK